MPGIDIRQRRAWNGAPLVFVVGPGGAGKTTVCRLLAPILGRDLIDLDETFCSRVGQIDQYIRSAGYAAYKQANGRLARLLANEASRPAIMATSSGFLSLDNPPETLMQNGNLVAQGYSICLLPDADPDLASDIIVARQLDRGFSRDAARERRTIGERFPVYKAAGDMIVFSAAPAAQIAAAIAGRLG
ncbi:MAG: shikimate kinase [Reyranellaceae bacterium]